MKWFNPLPGAAVLLSIFTSCSNHNSGFKFTETDQGIGLTENGTQVLFYQKAPRTLTGEYICNNYIHPLFNLSGDTLTEEFPADHPYHRGVFWTWHQIYLDTVSIGDGWINDGISQNVVKLLTEIKDDAAQIDLEVNWHSDTLPEEKPFMKERTTIVVYPAMKDVRKLDFNIELNALVEKLEIGGSDDPKGYGGFCIRLDIPEDMVFISESGQVTPQEFQVNTGRWMDFSGAFGRTDDKNGIAILCHPGNPVFPSPWILRQKASMQNAVFPGRERVRLEINTPLILKYRLVIHKGDASAIDFNKLQDEYSRL
ncbi:MAG: PmoA family protein [Bacteroidia bacterium]|nr:PmoA family protein [Bacteroidia bacterium]